MGRKKQVLPRVTEQNGDRVILYDVKTMLYWGIMKRQREILQEEQEKFNEFFRYALLIEKGAIRCDTFELSHKKWEEFKQVLCRKES